MAYRILKRMFRNVQVSKDLLHKLVDGMDMDGNGRISLAEVAVALKILWNQAMGKIKPKKTKASKIKILE